MEAQSDLVTVSPDCNKIGMDLSRTNCVWLYAKADGEGQEWLDSHKQRAEKLIYLFYALIAVALRAALIPAKAPKTARPLALLTVLVALAALAAGAWIAKAGGQIRHPEFRHESSSKPTPTGRGPWWREELFEAAQLKAEHYE